MAVQPDGVGLAPDAVSWLLFAAAAIMPAQLLITRSAIRQIRLNIIEQMREQLFKEHNLPQVEFIKAKYDADSDGFGPTAALLLTALIFTLVTYAGLSLMLRCGGARVRREPRSALLRRSC